MRVLISGDGVVGLTCGYWLYQAGRGRVVLIGDVCGALTFTSAQGASLAMAGGYLLAEALAPTLVTIRPRLQRMRRACGLWSLSASAAPAPWPAGCAGHAHRPERPAHGHRLVLREACAPLLRRGFGNTSSILPIPPNDAKETEQ